MDAPRIRGPRNAGAALAFSRAPGWRRQDPTGPSHRSVRTVDLAGAPPVGSAHVPRSTLSLALAASPASPSRPLAIVREGAAAPLLLRHELLEHAAAGEPGGRPAQPGADRAPREGADRRLRHQPLQVDDPGLRGRRDDAAPQGRAPPPHARGEGDLEGRPRDLRPRAGLRRRRADPEGRRARPRGGRALRGRRLEGAARVGHVGLPRAPGRHATSRTPA